MPEEKKEDKIEEKKEVHSEHSEHHTEHKPEHVEHSEHKKNKKVNWTKLGILIIIIALILILIWPGKVLLNKSGQTTTMLNVSYSAYVDGVSIKNNSGLFTEGTLDKELGFASDKLDQAIKAMSPGQEKNITLTAAEAYGTCDSTKTTSINRTEIIPREQTINRTRTIDTSTFNTTFGEMPQLNKVYTIPGSASGSYPGFQYKVIKIDNQGIKLSLETYVGQEWPAQYFIAKVTTFNDDNITLRFEGNNSIVPTASGDYEINFTQDKVIFTLTPTIGQEIELIAGLTARVTGMNSTNIFLDANIENCGKDIVVNVKLISRVKQSSAQTGSSIKHIDGAPTLQSFVVSNCPYGLQMQRILVDVYKSIGNKANIEVRYIGSISGGEIQSMHGADEAAENLKQICMREEQSNIYWNYIACYIRAGDSTGCLASTNVDTSKLDSCVTDQNRGLKYAQVDFDFANQYSVSGSPTNILDGKQVSEFDYGAGQSSDLSKFNGAWGRSPEAVKNMICAAFTTKPAECNTALIKDQTPTGFSTSGTGSGSGGTCG